MHASTPTSKQRNRQNIQKKWGAKTEVGPQRSRFVWRAFVWRHTATIAQLSCLLPASVFSRCLVRGQIWAALSKDNKGLCWDMPAPSSDKAPSILFFHLPRLMQLDDTTSTLICSQFPTNISHLTQTFPPGCYFCCCQYVIDTNEVTLGGSRLLSPRRVNQKLLMESTRHRYRSLSGEEQRKSVDISSMNTRIDLCVAKPTVPWLTSNTIKWKREDTEDRHYINHQSFLHLPSSVICALNLMSFVCSWTNFTVNKTTMSSHFMLAQSHNDRKTKIKRKRQRKSKNKRLFLCSLSVFSTQGQGSKYCRIQHHSWDSNTRYNTGLFQVCRGTSNKGPWWSLRYYMHAFLLY